MTKVKVKTDELIGPALEWAASEANKAGKVQLKDIPGLDDWRVSVDDNLKEFVRANLGDEVDVPAELIQPGHPATGKITTSPTAQELAKAIADMAEAELATHSTASNAPTRYRLVERQGVLSLQGGFEVTDHGPDGRPVAVRMEWRDIPKVVLE